MVKVRILREGYVFICSSVYPVSFQSHTLAYTPEELTENRFEANEKDFGSGPVLNTPSPYKISYRDEWYKALEECGVPYNANAVSPPHH